MRRVTVMILVMLALAVWSVRANSGLEWRGQLSANETEMQEGYFAIADDTVLMVRPGSPMHEWLKAHAGQVVRVAIEPAATAER